MNKSFIFGGNTGLTYDELQRERAIADQLAATASGGASSISEGASQLGAAIGFRIRDARARKGMEAGRNAFNDEFSAFLGGGAPSAPQGAAASSLPAGGQSASPVRPPSPAPAADPAATLATGQGRPTDRPRPQSAIGEILGRRGLQPEEGIPTGGAQRAPSPQQPTPGIGQRQPHPSIGQQQPPPGIGQQQPPHGAVPQNPADQIENRAPIQTASLDPSAGFNQAVQRPQQPSNLLAAISTDTRAVNRPVAGTTNISLDFNAAPKGDGRGTEVIIPDNASPEIRAAAEAYNERIVAFARANGIPDYPNRGVKTRSQNGRGVSHTVHTEPFFNSDIEFQNLVKNNMDEFASITAGTFGQLEGARIIPPHGVGKDRGAASPVFGNETAFGKQVVNSILGQSGGQTPSRPSAVPQTSAPQNATPQRAAQAQGLAGVNPQLLRMAQNPYATPQQQQIISSMIQQQIAQNAPPSRADQLAANKFEFEQRKFGATQQREDARLSLERQRFEAEQRQRQNEANEPINVGGTLVDPNTFEPVFQSPDKPTGLLQEYNRHVELAQSRGETPMSLVEYQIALKQAGASRTNVSVGGEPNDGALRKELNKKTGELWSTYQTQGATAAALNGDLDVLDELIELAPQGAVTGRLASIFPGVSSAGDAFNSIVRRVAPTLRAPGSGSTSDIEYDGMLQSLPALRNRPEANAMISQILRSKNSINLERSRIVDEYANNTIPASDARNKIAELDRRSIVTPAMRRALEGLGARFDTKGGEEKDGWTEHNGVRIRKKQ